MNRKFTRMHQYWAYNLTIHSELLLPELEPGEPAPPDVVIRTCRFDESTLEGIDGGARFLGRVPGIGWFLLDHGREILIQAAPGLSEDRLRVTLLGPIFSILLRQRGMSVLHASAVVVDGGAVAFIGACGAGKSTTAEAFYARGYPVLVDDVLAIDYAGERPIVIPGHPQLKLMPDAAEAFAGDDGSLPELFDQAGKLSYRAGEGFPRTSFPLRKIYVLDRGPEHSIEPLSSQESFQQLVVHSRAHQTLLTPVFAEAHLRQCARVVGEVPVARLRRRLSLAALPEVLDLIERDIAAGIQQETA